MEPADRLRFGPFPTAIITGGRVGVTVAHELLHNDDIGAGIEQIAGKGAPPVMGREPLHPGLVCSLHQKIVDGRVADAFGQHSTTLVDR